jgi:hypothetical protein
MLGVLFSPSQINLLIKLRDIQHGKSIQGWGTHHMALAKRRPWNMTAKISP